jgi:tetratricopeptide (TPR) repeat protein
VTDNPVKKPFLNSITGQVWDPNGRPASNIYVELLTELNSSLARQRTSNAGLYSFTGISAGRFKIHVITLGTDYLDQTQDVQIMNLIPGMSDNQYVDFYLRYDPRRVNVAGSGGAAEDIFVQEGLPKEAEKHYTKGVSLLQDKKPEKAIVEFRQAIELFPNYYYALNALGKELVEQKKWDESLEYLIRAIDINQRSFSGYYALAYACYQLRQIPQAIEAARAATILKSSSLNAQLLYGTVSRLAGNYEIAEKSLLKAKTLGNNKVANVNWQLALLYNRQNKNKQAADELDMYLKNDPNGKDRKEVRELIEKLRMS